MQRIWGYNPYEGFVLIGDENDEGIQFQDFDWEEEEDEEDEEYVSWQMGYILMLENNAELQFEQDIVMEDVMMEEERIIQENQQIEQQLAEENIFGFKLN